MKDYHFLFIIPNRFKAVGLIVAVASAVVLLVSDLNPPMPRTVLSVFILGLLLFVLAREKHEDEMVVRARYVSLMHATVVGIFMAVIVPPLMLWMQTPATLGFQELALAILCTYIVNFQWFLIQSKREKHD